MPGIGHHLRTQTTFSTELLTRLLAHTVTMGGGTESEQQMLTGGIRSAYLQITHGWLPDRAEIVGALSSRGSYDPRLPAPSHLSIIAVTNRI